MKDFLPLLILLMLLAALLREEAVLTVFYLVGGVYLAGYLWTKTVMRRLKFDRVFTNRVFLNETVPIRLRIKNLGWLPVIWLQTHESLPVGLGVTKPLRSALSIASHGHADIEYQVYARKRGYYQIGPLYLRSGDFLGLGGDQERVVDSDSLIVYPKIIPLTRIALPSRSPLGNIKHPQPVFEDPSRLLGKRDYQVGDSQRRIDWKSSASSGKLQVKQFDSSISLETAIFLNLDTQDYDLRSRYDSVELAIVVAASIATWITNQKQAVGLYANGIDPFETQQVTRPVRCSKGRGHLMRILDTLARVQAGKTTPFIELLHQESPRLSWGTTQVLITSQVEDPIFEQLFQARRFGLNPLLVQVGPHPGLQGFRQKSEQFHIPYFQVHFEDDLDMWRK